MYPPAHLATESARSQSIVQRGGIQAIHSHVAKRSASASVSPEIEITLAPQFVEHPVPLSIHVEVLAWHRSWRHDKQFGVMRSNQRSLGLGDCRRLGSRDSNPDTRHQKPLSYL
jgi:hypothetical protein